MASERMKVHITLVGGQQYPIYVGIKEANPDKLVMVCSEQSRNDAVRISRVAGMNRSNVELVLCDADDVSSANEVIRDSIVRDIVDKYSDCEYTVSLTGGPKPWSMFLLKLLYGRENVSLLYYGQNGDQCDLIRASQKKSSIPLDMDILFRLKNAETRHYRKFSELTQDDLYAVSVIDEFLSQNHDLIGCFTVMTNPVQPQNRSQIQPGFCYPPDEYGDSKQQVKFTRMHHKYDGSNLNFYIEKGCEKADGTIRIKKKNDIFSIPFYFEAPHLKDLLFFAGWFEVMVARMLSVWKSGQDIRVGVRFDFASSMRLKNEIDIIMNTGNKLLFVECKTRIMHLTDLDKFNNVVKTYGGTGSKALFVSYYGIDKDVEEKCGATDIAYFSIEDARARWKAKHKAEVGQDSGFEQMNSAVQQEFNELLNKKLKASNKI